MTQLPIDDVLPEIRRVLRDGTSAVLRAPPGAGKTTRVPLALMDEPWLGGKRIVMLEPRRLAARAAAAHMARLLGERVGGSVGYRIRQETRVGRDTRIEIVTEGVLVRMLQEDPALEAMGLVIFDEFHERSLHADLGLALTLAGRSLFRPDLKVLVMSATLDTAPIAALLGGAPVVESAGRAYPTETHYLREPVSGRIEAAVARATLRALESAPGDVLVFLPGAAEIHRTAELLESHGPGDGVRVHPLFGNLPQEAQDRAIAPSPPGERKVVLATSIAETSLTIEGVRTVVDSGLARVPRFSPRTGLTRLETVTVSRAAADQRRGRAGRLGPGVCFRLWTEATDRTLQPFAPPEILDSDLAPLALELAAWGVADPNQLEWLDPPPAAAYAQARELLGWLGALDAAGAITPHGRAMAELGVHPRLAHMLIASGPLGQAPLACIVAAILQERDPLRPPRETPDADLRTRVEAILAADAGRLGGSYRGIPVDRGAVHRIRDEARRLRDRLPAAERGRNAPPPIDPEATGLVLAFAYPDRIAQRRPGQRGRYLLRGGRGARLDPGAAVADAEYLVAAEISDLGADPFIYLAAPIDEAEIRAHFGDSIATADDVEWDCEKGGIRARRRERLGAIVMRESEIRDPDQELVRQSILDAIRTSGLAMLPWSDEATGVRDRIAFVARHEDGWPDVRDQALLEELDAWLAPHLHGVRRAEELRRLDLARIVAEMLPWDRRRRLDELAPTHVAVPSGSRIAIDYSDPEAPVLAVRLQELFGLAETPRIMGGRIPLTLHLLSPARRPVQVTRDLASFWREAYFEVRKDLRGRYPRHYWPDDPLVAEATRRVRPRGS